MDDIKKEVTEGRRAQRPRFEEVEHHKITHKQTEEAMRESEERYRCLFEQSPVGIGLITPDGKVVAANKTMEVITGYFEEELKKINLAETYENPQDRKKLLETIERCGCAVDFAVRLRRKDGTVYNALLNVSRVHLEDQDLFQTIFTDVTDRKLAEEVLRMSEQRYRTLIESCHEVILRKDRDGYYHTLNLKAAIGLGGRCIEDIEGKTDYDLLPKEQADALRKIDKEVMESGKDIEVEEVVRNAQGEDRIYLSRKWPIYDSQGRINGISCFAMDITERKRAEVVVRESHDYLERLTNSMWDAVFSVKMPGRIIEWANDSFRLTGYAPEECVGKTTEFLYPGKSEFIDFGNKLKKAIKAGDDVLHAEQTLRRKNGESFPAEITTTIFKEKGEIDRVTSIVRDITEHKRAEEALREYQQELKSLASQLTLAEERERRRIAVDLHDHVSQSLSSSKMKLQQLLGAAPPRRATDTLDEVCNLLGESIGQMRSLTFDLSSPVLYELGFETAVADWLEEQIGKRHNIKAEFADDGQAKPLDDDIRVLLFRNVRELLINVVKHAHAQNVKVSVGKAGSEIEVRVEDDGWGFEPEKAAARGTKEGGFGLFSIRERLEQLGGHLEIKSAPGQGCRVTMRAPLRKTNVTNEG